VNAIRSKSIPFSYLPPLWGKVPTALRSSAHVGGRGVCRREIFILPLVILCACETNDAGYFPATELTDDNGYHRRWFSRYFLTMNEPVLYRQINVDYSVRLTRLTDEVDAFSLRIDRLNNGEIFASYKRFNYVRAGELNPRPAAVLARKLAPAEFSRLTAEVARQEFFSLPEQTEFVEGNIVWLLEVYDGTKFHAVVTPAMQRSRPFGAIAAVAGEVTQIRDATGG
jgi:hypothetical protein